MGEGVDLPTQDGAAGRDPTTCPIWHRIYAASKYLVSSRNDLTTTIPSGACNTAGVCGALRTSAEPLEHFA